MSSLRSCQYLFNTCHVYFEHQIWKFPSSYWQKLYNGVRSNVSIARVWVRNGHNFCKNSFISQNRHRKATKTKTCAVESCMYSLFVNKFVNWPKILRNSTFLSMTTYIKLELSTRYSQDLLYKITQYGMCEICPL